MGEEGKKACFGCGSYEHLKAECPKENGGSRRERGRGRRIRRGGFRPRNRISEVEGQEDDYESYTDEEEESESIEEDEIYGVSEGVRPARF